MQETEYTLVFPKCKKVHSDKIAKICTFGKKTTFAVFMQKFDGPILFQINQLSKVTFLSIKYQLFLSPI